MSKRKTFTQILNEQAKARTAQIKIGGSYFLSDFHDRTGFEVRVLSKSTKRNAVGIPSSVEFEILAHVGCDAALKRIRPLGFVGTCNACNLYERREDAAFNAKR